MKRCGAAVRRCALFWGGILVVPSVVVGCHRVGRVGDLSDRFLWGESRGERNYAVVGADGRLLETRAFPLTVGLLEPTPDRTGYFRRHVAVQVPGARSRATVSIGGREVISRPLGEGARLMWTSIDGSSFLFQEGSTLTFWSLCAGEFRTEEVERDIAVWSASATQLYVSKNSNPRQILRRGLFDRGAILAVEFAEPFDQILAGDEEASVVVSKVLSGSPPRVHFWIADLERRRLEPIAPPDDVWVTDARSLVGASVLLLEVWPREETHSDGVPRTRFALWNYRSGALSELFANPHGLRPFSAAKNVPRISPRCGETSGTASTIVRQ